jgi:hypothetical protein
VLVYYLPIYFQAILGCTAIESGIRNLALVVPVCKLYLENYIDFDLLTNKWKQLSALSWWADRSRCMATSHPS